MYLLLASAQAATLTVGDGGAYSTLSSAIAAAADGDTLQLSAGTFVGAHFIEGKNLSLVGVGAETVLDGAGAERALEVSGATVTLQDLTVTNELGGGVEAVSSQLLLEGVGFVDVGDEGLVGGGLRLTWSDAELVDCSFEDGVADSGGHVFVDHGLLDIQGGSMDGGGAEDGGAIYAISSELVLTDTELTSNDATVSGGAIYATGSELRIQGSLLQANTIYEGYGAAIYVTETSLVLEDSQLWDNAATYGYGGAIWATYLTPVTISGCDISGNEAYRSGGAVGHYYSYTTLDVVDTVFDDNRSRYGYGGAVYAYYESVTSITDSTLSRNEATYHGGGLYMYYGRLQAERVSFERNSSGIYSGGGAYLYYLWGGEKGATLDTVRFEGNEASLEGGGLYARYLTTLDIRSSSFHDNEGEDGLYGGGAYLSLVDALSAHQVAFTNNRATYGGGLYSSDGSGTAEISGLLVQENRARIGGGAIWAGGVATPITNSTWLGNQALDEASALGLYDARLDMVNALFAHNAGAPAMASWDLNSGFYSSWTWSSWYDNAHGDVEGELVEQDWFGEGGLTEPPGFVLWTDNNDPDDDMLVLAPGSAMIDAGDPDVLDPDGSRSDIGAFGGELLSVQDSDGDGWQDWQDCDDEDASVHPGATETWYDGIDSDCGGDDDYDQDGDAVVAAEDCDDTDADVQDCPETEDPLPDSGLDAEGRGDKGGDCSTAPRAPWWLAFAALGLLLRRRPAR